MKKEVKKLKFKESIKKRLHFVLPKNSKRKIEILELEETKRKKKSKLHIKSKYKLVASFSAAVILLIATISFKTKTNIIAVSSRKFLDSLGIYTQVINKTEVKQDGYDDSVPGTWHINKSAYWTGDKKAKMTLELDSIIKTTTHHKDIILLIDTSSSMSGERLGKTIESAKDLAEYVLNDDKNRMALVTFDTTSTILSSFSSDKENIYERLDSITTGGNTNYNAALQNVNEIMTGYIEEKNRDVVALMITDGYPNEGNPNQLGTYEILKDKYPFMNIHFIQYEMGTKLIEEIKAVSDAQWIADYETLGDIIFEASVSPIAYEKFIIEEPIQNDYFLVHSNDIKATLGTVTIEEKSGVQNIVWDLGKNYTTGGKAKIEINLTLKEQYAEEEGYYPISQKEITTSKLPDENEKETGSNATAVLKNSYEVFYDTNTPDGCNLENINSEKYFVYKTVTKKTENLVCEGYLFKGWEVVENDDEKIIYMNNDMFLMPQTDVTIRGTWSRQSIVKSMDGTVHETTNLYRVLKAAAEEGTYAKEYTGEHKDSISGTGNQKIYHWYATNADNGDAIKNKNNVIFADQCWQIVRTTDTGGIKMIYNGAAVNDQCLTNRGTNNNVGYGVRMSQNLAGNYWYGTDYEFDSTNRKFKVTGTLEKAVWSAATSEDLIGKYTCKLALEDGTCAQIYLVESYYNTTQAYVIPITSTSHYSYFGKLQYNATELSLASIGYMLGDIYPYNQTRATTSQTFTATERLLTGGTLTTSYWYADDTSYDSIEGLYSLVSPYQVESASDYENLVGKYTFPSASETNTGMTVSYIAAVNASTMYYKQLQMGNLLDAYNPIVFGDSITDNNDGTFTLNNTESVSLIDWYTTYADYKNKYTCNSSSDTCENPRYTTATSSTSYTYINGGEKVLIAKTRNGLTLEDTLLVRKDELVMNPSNYEDYKYTCNTTSEVCTDASLRMIDSFNATGYAYAPNHYWGSSVTWDGTNYTLVDSMGIENYKNLEDMATHHYICTELGQKTCPSVAYVYYYKAPGSMYYITLSDGVTNVSKALENMLTKNINNSSIKSGIDAWYKKYLLEYDDYIEDTIFCNDRSITSLGGWDPNGGMVDVDLKFKEYDISSDLSCTNVTDQFSVSNLQAKLTYPVGLISIPEMNILGDDRVRATGQYYWTSSPVDLKNGYSPSARFINNAGKLITNSGGYINGSATVTDTGIGVRPSISLISGIEYSDGDGSMENPYIIDLEG